MQPPRTNWLRRSLMLAIVLIPIAEILFVKLR
jgi:hypothetical protein